MTVDEYRARADRCRELLRIAVRTRYGISFASGRRISTPRPMRSNTRPITQNKARNAWLALNRQEHRPLMV
jgi:hypothetical protein